MHRVRVVRGAPRWSRHAVALVALAGALVCAIASPAHGEIDARSREVIARFIAATGGADVMPLRSLHDTYAIEVFGMKGTIETWSEAPNRRASATEIGPFKLREGFDGTVGWRTEPSGSIVVLDGKDLEDARGSAWFENDRWTLPDQDGGTIRFVGEERDSLGRYVVLEITPPTGRSRRYGFDPVTGFPTRVESKRDQLTAVTRLSDYREHSGRKLATRQVTEPVGMPANRLVVTLETAGINEPITGNPFARPQTETPVTWLKTPGQATLPFGYTTRHLWLKVSVNGGPPADFLFDTGASITVLDSAWAARNGIATEGLQQGQGAGAIGTASFAKLASLRIAAPDGDGIEVRDSRAGVLSLNPTLAPFFWRDIAGVVGFDVIHRFVTTIDYQARTMTLRDPKAFTAPAGATVVPMTIDGHIPTIEMTLDDSIGGRFRLDVGSSSTLDLHAPFVAKYGLMARAGRGDDVTGGGFGGTFSTRLTRMRSLSLGPYTWQEPLVTLSAASAGAFASEDYAGNVGNRLLERFRVTFDYERRQLLLEPGPGLTARDPFSLAGVQFARFPDGVKAMQILPGSAAEKAGLKLHDRLVSLEGIPVDKLDPEQVTRFLDEGRPGEKRRIEVMRDGKKKKLTLTLAEVL